jgi:peroxiredoxin
VTQLRRREKEFQAAEIQVLLVGLGNPQQTEAFRRDYRLNFPFACDPQRRLYEAFGLRKTSLLGLASPGVLFKGLKALGSGHGLGIPQQDIYQLSGVFVIDTQGTIRFSHRSQDPADHPSADEILRAAAQVKESADER